MRRGVGKLALAAGFLLVAGAWWWGQRGAPVLADSPTAAARVAMPATRADASRAVNDNSLRGTGVDGEIHLDAEGRPVADRDMRRLFDYFLARIGEQPLPAIRAALAAHIARTVPPQAAGEVLERYDTYVALLQDMAALSPTGDDLADAARLHDLRRARLGEVVAEAWFGAEERYLQNRLARQAVLADKTLDAAARAGALAALDAALDPEQRAARAPTDQLDDAVAQTEAFDAAGTSAGERLAQRQAAYGSDAAERLAALDHERAAWNARLADFAVQRQRLLADTRLTGAARARALDTLLQSRFNDRERLRVDALTRLGQLPASP